MWGYIKHIAKERLHNNITERHVYKYGSEIEVIGAAGELAARTYLGLPQKLHTTFDGGRDLVFGDRSINVKATKLTENIHSRHLLWPLGSPVRCDAAILVGVDTQARSAKVLGFATCDEILSAPINHTRYLPCQEIDVAHLHPIRELCSPTEKAHAAPQDPQGVRP